MSEFKFPPGMEDPAHLFREWKAHSGVLTLIGNAQRDAVTAARREVESDQAVRSRIPFGGRLTLLLNEFSAEGPSNTPDFILAEYLQNCLSAFNGAQQRRQQHFERPKVYDLCRCTGKRVYYYVCFYCNKPLMGQSV